MPRTQLRRRKADAYRVRTPPSVLQTLSDGIQRAAWDDAHERVVYQRLWGHWRHAEGDPGTIVDEGYRRDEIAHVPLGQVPFDDVMDGAKLAEFNSTTPGAVWPPRPGVSSWALEDGERFVDALVVHPVTGAVAVLWHLGATISEWWDQTLRVSVFDSQGVLTGQSETAVADDFWSWPSPIQAAWGAGGLYCLEPAPPGVPKEGGWQPMRVTRRTGAGLGVGAERLLSPADDIGAHSVCADPQWPGAWVFYTRDWAGGTGPFPARSGTYEVEYVLPLDGGLLGTEELITFGFDNDPDIWQLDDAPIATGARVVLDSAAGDPTFVAIGANPNHWPDDGPNDSIWRFKIAAGGEQFLSEASLPEPSTAWTAVHRIGAGGQYLLHRDVLGHSSSLAVVALP